MTTLLFLLIILAFLILIILFFILWYHYGRKDYQKEMKDKAFELLCMVSDIEQWTAPYGDDRNFVLQWEKVNGRIYYIRMLQKELRKLS